MVAPRWVQCARPGENWGGASYKAPSHSGCGSSKLLEQQFQSELDLPRVVRRIARRADSAEVVVGPVGGAADGHDAVTAEAGRVKVRVVKDVEDFRAELKLALLVERKVLKDGEVKSVEAGAGGLRDASQVRKGASTDSARGWIREGTRSSRRIQKRVIVEPAEFSEAIVVETDLQGLPGV